MKSTSHNSPSRQAEARDVGAACPHCQRLIESSDRVVTCSSCGTVHHEPCWMEHDGCGTYECAPVRRVLPSDQQAEIRITASELDGTVPLPKPVRPGAPSASPAAYTPRRGVATPGTRNRLAVASAIVAMAAMVFPGVFPFVGVLGRLIVGLSLLTAIITGLVASLMGAIALGQLQKAGQRGTLWGVAGILIGLGVTVGSIVLMAFAVPQTSRSMVSIDDFQMDPSALEGVQPHIARALRANVFIESSLSLVGQAIGSGVIVGEQDGETLIVTNRHVVDGEFRDQGASSGLPSTELTVRAIGQLPVAGRVVWVAPDGLDIAVISAPIHSDEAEAAPWDDAHPAMGDEVFCIGNPQGLEWTYTKGSVSQVRTRRYGSRQIAMIQTDTAINPGNSGGGLYDDTGNLIGINTWTNDKRMSEGLSFAISFASIVQLDPPFARNP